MNNPVTHAECNAQTERQTGLIKDHISDAMQPVMDKIELLFTGQEYVKHKLFEDNGVPCIQTRLNKNDDILKKLMWLVGILTTSTIGGAVTLIVAIIRHMVVG